MKLLLCVCCPSAIIQGDGDDHNDDDDDDDSLERVNRLHKFYSIMLA